MSEPSSDHKMLETDYIRARVLFLKIEREFRRKVGVIVQRPAEYDKICDQEIWDDDVQEIWDATREFNLDEVPFIINMKSKQIVAMGERASIVKSDLKYNGKYRQGTLVLVTNYTEILLIVIVFPNGGSGVRAKLVKDMQGTLYSFDKTGKKRTTVMWECTMSGSVTTYIWKKY